MFKDTRAFNIFMMVFMLLIVSQANFESRAALHVAQDDSIEFMSYDEAVNRPLESPASAAQVSAVMSHTVKILHNIYEDSIGEVKFAGSESGSGTIIAKDTLKNKSLVLTADHVCQTSVSAGDVLGLFLSVQRVDSFVVTAENKEIKMRVKFRDVVNDICIIEVDGVFGTPAYISSFYPPIGTEVVTAGAPSGQWLGGLANVVFGRYIGESAEDIRLGASSFKKFQQYSIPTIGGMSGSAVYYNGRFFSILTIGHSEYENIAWGPGLNYLYPFVTKSIKRWEKRNGS